MLRHYLILLLLVTASCTKNTEEVITLDPGAGKSVRDEIIAFAGTVNSLSAGSIKQESLVYTLNDYSFHVSRYVRNSEVSLYIEHGYSANRGDTENKYYLKEGKVVLFIQNVYDPKNALPYKTARTFYKDGNIVYSDLRAAKAKDELASSSFTINDLPHKGIEADMKKLNDAIYQRGSFDLLLEGITEYPKAKYLILSRNKVNSYRAALLIETKDELIKSIIANPEKYRGRKLNVRWNLKSQNEAVYVSGNLAD